MKLLNIIILFLSSIFSINAFAQNDVFSGTWMMDQQSVSGPDVHMELQIGLPENNLLYPSRLILQCGEFSGVYDVLLVKKNIRQLAVGKNKWPVIESPFKLGTLTVLLNGILDLNRDNKGAYFLTEERLLAKKYDVAFPKPTDYKEENKPLLNNLSAFITNGGIRLKKINDTSSVNENVLNGSQYHGIIDSILTNEREAVIEFHGSKKISNGIVSVSMNGMIFIDQADLSYKKPREEILLDTGLNILVLFADVYGKTPGVTGNLHFRSGQKNVIMDFNSPENIASTFIVAKIYYYPSKDVTSAMSELQAERKDENVLVVKNPNSINSTNKVKGPIDSITRSPLPENVLLRNATLAGSAVVHSAQITLAIWDDAIEDGDSISLSLNGKWIVQGLAVKKKPQFISVLVQPGPNKITFIADNLGSIIPNTSVLEIIDGRQRKSFMINTNLRQNNLIDIFYDYTP